mgnify:CR=1 FL=1
MDDMIARAKWSDAFFNYVPAEQAENSSELLDAANTFVEANPDCPIVAVDLVEDFKRRL